MLAACTLKGSNTRACKNKAAKCPQRPIVTVVVVVIFRVFFQRQDAPGRGRCPGLKYLVSESDISKTITKSLEALRGLA